MLFSGVKKNLILAVALLLLTTTLSCGDDDGGPAPEVEPTVYIVGTELLEDGTTDIHYYVGDQRTTIPGNGTYMISIGISADESDVYVSGNIRDNVGNSAAYWKNGVLNPLNNTGGYQSNTAGHTFWNGDIYVFGSLQQELGNEQAIYWKNGQEVLLESQFNRTRATGMALVNGKIIVAGYAVISGVGSIPLIWEDGVPRQLSAGNTRGVRPLDIKEHQGDYYMYGLASSRSEREPVLLLWKNGVLTEINRNNMESVPDIEITGYNGDIYYLIQEVTATGRNFLYSRNGEDVIFVSDAQDAVFLSAMDVANDKVYVAGNLQTQNPNGGFIIQPQIWFDGVEQLDYVWPDFFQVFDMYVR